MIRFQKFEDKIYDLLISNDEYLNIGVLNNGELVKCNREYCSDCIFQSKLYCKVSALRWFFAEEDDDYII